MVQLSKLTIERHFFLVFAQMVAAQTQVSAVVSHDQVLDAQTEGDRVLVLVAEDVDVVFVRLVQRPAVTPPFRHGVGVSGNDAIQDGLLAHTLANALVGQPYLRGVWGEIR